MGEKLHRDLERGKELYRAQRLAEAYTYFRRYYDRLPFKPEPDHANYIGMFVRTLFELGKDRELTFYTNELEKIYEKTRNPEAGFQLAYLYCHSGSQQLRGAKLLLEQILRMNLNQEVRIKAKICLAYAYDELDNDVASCRQIIDSIEAPTDRSLYFMVETWRAKVLWDEQKLDEAEKILRDLLEEMSFDNDWNEFATANIILAGVFVKRGKTKEAEQILDALKMLCEERPMKSIRKQIADIEKLMDKDRELGVIQIEHGSDTSVMRYGSKSLPLGSKSCAEKLLLLLAKRRFVEKMHIVQELYDRQYVRDTDDKLIYYHIHTVRKVLKKVGLPTDAVTSHQSGYRLVPEVKFSGGEI